MKTIVGRTVREMRAAALLALALFPFEAFAQTLSNPTSGAGINDISGFIAAFLKAVVEISLPILTLFIVYAGFKFVFARGKPEGIAEAKKNFMYVVIGAILILGAWVLATLIAATATQVLGTS
ncbi:MAG TPA: pilin [Candidatus Paceibacterota bacterium]|jgi:hypothetical protein|nr:pilin [Candidatus Paceibacterota bacterium]